MKRVLSLDASSTTIGIAIIDYNDSSMILQLQEYYKPPKKGNLFERLAAVRQFIQDKIDEFEPNDVAMEDIVLFMGSGPKCPICKKPTGGGSTAKTITTLAILNRTVGLAIYDKMNKAPYLYNAMRIRHAIKLDKTLPPKEEIPNVVATILGFKFDFKMKKSKGKLVPSEENYDMADAIACGICHVYMDREGKADQLQVKKKKKRKKKVPKK
jgi:Holliday junction resolvasome RuvABC endonuclease subunit